MTITVGRIGSLWRYPVKSTLGEQLDSVEVGPAGVDSDRRFGIIEPRTGVVATAKRPKRWQRLLLLRSELIAPDVVRIHFPDGRSFLSSDDLAGKVLSEFLGEEVELRDGAPPGTELERASPDAVLEQGADADVEVVTMPVAGAAPEGTFFDFSPLQLVTTASLAAAGAQHPSGAVEAARYRPNFVVDTTAELTGFVENGWVGHQLHVGPEVVVEVLIPSPRCAVPTLRHGDLPPDPDALRVPMRHNFVPVPLEGFGSAPCLGAHAGVVRGGRVTAGDELRLAP